MANDPIHQFQIKNIVELGSNSGFEFAFTNSALFMFATIATITAFLLISTRGRTLVPNRLQSMAEITYEFVANTLRSTSGQEGMRFFPLVFSLFTFILVANLFGMVPYFFTVTSHLIVTLALAMIVILTVVGYGIAHHGLGFFKVFVPSGVPGALLPLVSTIEVFSFLSRPISLSVRLFANMLAGHITLKVFAGFVADLSSLGLIGIIGASLPLVMTVAITALEFLVAFMQAYVFAILTCIYLNDALHPHH